MMILKTQIHWFTVFIITSVSSSGEHDKSLYITLKDYIHGLTRVTVSGGNNWLEQTSLNDKTYLKEWLTQK